MKIALVTGANRGLGFETAKQLGKHGFKVYMGCRDEKKGKAAEEILKSERLQVEYVKLDVTKTSQVRDVLDLFRARGEVLDVLVNNAGVFLEPFGAGETQENASIFKMDPVIILKTIEANTMGPLKLIQSVVPLMIEKGHGRVINVSSGMGQLQDMGAGWPGYRMSKTALNALTRILAAEVSEHKIFVNSVCPGWVRTDMGGENANLSIEEGVDTIVWLATCENSPHGRFLRKREIIEW